MAEQGDLYLAFRLGSAQCGIRVRDVRELIGLMKFTEVPRMPPYMKGVINLRGRVIPVVDLKARIGMQATEPTKHACIIVLNLGREVGVMVDAVSEVVNIPDENIASPTAVGHMRADTCVMGFGATSPSVTVLLDIERALATKSRSGIGIRNAGRDPHLKDTTPEHGAAVQHPPDIGVSIRSVGCNCIVTQDGEPHQPVNLSTAIG